MATTKKQENKKVKIEKKPANLSVDVFDVAGKVVEKIKLPSAIFGTNINKKLIAQAIRVYRANQRLGTASTKTRGEVQGSSRKIYRQKGTGRARHGTVRAPIFVHGGIVGGPKPRDFSMKLPQKMKRSALFASLTDKLASNQIKIIQGLDKIEPKTKKFTSIIDKLGLTEKKKNKKILLITSSEIENLKRAARNVAGITIAGAKRLNTYDILGSHYLLFMKDAISEMEGHFLKSKKRASDIKKSNEKKDK